MWIAPLWLALLASGQGADPETLVARLAADEVSEQTEAADALEVLGLDALPALRVAAGSDDPELSRQARELAGRIRATRLLRPTLVTLEARGVPMTEAVAMLERRSGFAVNLALERQVDWNARDVTVDTTGPIAFWRAFDQLADAAGAHLPFRRGFMDRYTDETEILLVDGATPDVPTSYAGPYRLVMTSMTRHRQVAEVRPPNEAEVRQQFTVSLALAAEPGILIKRNGPIQLLDAVDDQGRDLRPASTRDDDPNNSPFRNWSRPESASTIGYDLPLDIPDGGGGGRIAQLSGDMPIVAVGRVDEVLSFSLDGAEGKTFTGGGIAVEVRSVDGEPTHTVVLGVRESPPLAPPHTPPARADAPGHCRRFALRGRRLHPGRRRRGPSAEHLADPVGLVPKSGRRGGGVPHPDPPWTSARLSRDVAALRHCGCRHRGALRVHRPADSLTGRNSSGRGRDRVQPRRCHPPRLAYLAGGDPHAANGDLHRAGRPGRPAVEPSSPAPATADPPLDAVPLRRLARPVRPGRSQGHRHAGGRMARIGPSGRSRGGLGNRPGGVLRLPLALDARPPVARPGTGRGTGAVMCLEFDLDSSGKDSITQ